MSDDPIESRRRERTFWQAKPFVAIYNGVYQGVTTVAQMKRHGTMGLGSPAGLDGEAVVIDGVFYHVDTAGRVHELPDDASFCFAEVSFFHEQGRVELPRGLVFSTSAAIPDELGPFVDLHLPTTNTFFALRVRGTFAALETRTFAAPATPWPPLWQVLAGQVDFPFTDVGATLVGFRSPAYVTQFLGVPGYHLHGLTDGHEGGGHVLGFTVEQAVLEFDRLERWVVEIPTDPGFDEADLTYLSQQSGPCFPGCRVLAGAPLRPSR